MKNALHEDCAIVGHSQTMQELFETVCLISGTNSTVLLRGESGTGKELIAKAIHLGSPRKDRQLVCVNCAVLTETLFESELFGHERGSFTGAVVQRIGRFEAADGGTIFLDEIGDIPVTTQAKLLRVIQEGEFERVGSSKTKKVDVKVIAATNKDLEQGIRKGNFREDLYYRIKVIELKVPPLRERPEDIPLLVEHFIKTIGRKVGNGGRRASPEFIDSMLSYTWPGNVRELRNAVERALVFGRSETLGVSDLPVEVWQKPPEAECDTPPHKMSLDEVEKQHIMRVLRNVNGKRTEAASILGINRSTLYEKLRNYSVQPVSGGGRCPVR